MKNDVGRFAATDLDALLALEDTPPTAPTPEPAATPAPVTESPATPPPTPPTPEELSKNWRLHTEDTPEGKKEAAFYALRKAGQTMEAAWKSVYGTTAQPPPVTTTTPPTEPAPEVTKEFDAKLTTLDTELSDLDKQLKLAIEDADSAKQWEIGRKIDRKDRERERVSEQRQQAIDSVEKAKVDAQDTQFRQKSREAASQAIKEFPFLALQADGTKTPERLAFEDFLTTKREDPDYEAIFLSPHYPKILAREFAQENGKGKARAGSPPPPAPPPSRPAPGRTVTAEVITPGSGRPAFTPTRESLLKHLPEMPVKDLERLLAAGAKK